MKVKYLQFELFSSMPQPDPFSQLVQQAQQGSNTAMSELFEAFFDKIFHYVSRRVATRENAEDITSDIFLEVVKRLSDFRGDSSFATWVFQIASNKTAGFWRKQYKFSTVPLEDVLFHPALQTPPKKYDDTDAFDIAEQKWEATRNIVLDSLEYLSEKPRKLIELRFLKNYTLEETAEELQMKKNAVKVMQFRALKKLRLLAEENIITLKNYPS